MLRNSASNSIHTKTGIGILQGILIDVKGDIMDNTNSTARSFILRVVLLVFLVLINLWLIVGIQQRAAENNLTLGEEESPRSLALSEEGDDISYLVLDNPGALADDFFRDSYDGVLNQVYAENYKLNGLIERNGTVTKYSKKSSQLYTFSIRLIPSNNVVDVDVTVNDLANNYYVVNVKKGS